MLILSLRSVAHHRRSDLRALHVSGIQTEGQAETPDCRGERNHAYPQSVQKKSSSAGCVPQSEIRKRHTAPGK